MPEVTQGIRRWSLPFDYIIVACGEFRRLAQHTGFLLSWLLCGDVPAPTRVVGTSCGATALILYAMVAKYTKDSPAAGERAARRVMDIIENLRMSNIFTIPKRVRVALAITLIVSVASQSVELFLHGPWHRLVQFCLSGLWMVAVLYLMYRIITAASVFSTAPLMKTLETKIDWEAVRQSPVEVIILTTDCRTGKARAYSSKADVKDYSRYMCSLLAKSMRLPGTLEDYDIGTGSDVDAEISGNFPIEYACWPRGKYRRAFFLAYTLEGDWPHGKASFIQDIARSMSMQVYRHMRRKIKRYRRMYARYPNGGIPPLNIILTRERIPSLVFSSFSTESMQAGIAQGRRIFAENLPMIRRELGLDQPAE